MACSSLEDREMPNLNTLTQTFAIAVLIIPGSLFLVYGAMFWYNPNMPAEYAGLWVAHQDGMA